MFIFVNYFIIFHNTLLRPSEIPELETPESVEAVPGSITTSHVRFSAKRPKRLEGRARGLALLEDALKKIKCMFLQISFFS